MANPENPDPREHRTTYPLLGTLAVLLVVSPLVPVMGARGFVLDLAMTSVMFASFWTVHRDRRRLWTIAAVGAVAAVLLWVARATGSHGVMAAAFAVFGSTLAYVAAMLLRLVMRARRVSLDSVSGAIAAYLLIASIWACLFALLELFAPGSFTVQGQAIPKGGHPLDLMLYYALVTVTTVGYGDIVPVHPLARNLAALCAVSGQMYVAVLVAALVARFVADDVREG
jgi:hypothetical protein